MVSWARYLTIQDTPYQSGLSQWQIAIKCCMHSSHRLRAACPAQLILPNYITPTTVPRSSPVWTADSRSAYKEIPILLWDSKVHYRADKSPSPDHLTPAHTIALWINTIQLNLILDFRRLLDRQSDLSAFSFPDQRLYQQTQHFVSPVSSTTRLLVVQRGSHGRKPDPTADYHRQCSGRFGSKRESRRSA
jgi:hypothetical protein